MDRTRGRSALARELETQDGIRSGRAREGCGSCGIYSGRFSGSSQSRAPADIGASFRGRRVACRRRSGDDSDHRRSLMAIDGRVYDAQRFAIDWMKVGPNGDSHHDGTARNENFWGYGEAIHAVEDGEVSDVMDGIPENTPRVLPKPVTLDNISGNYVTLRI